MLMINFLILLILIVIVYFTNIQEHFINKMNILSELNESESEDLHNSLEHVHLKSNNSLAEEISHGESIYNTDNDIIYLEETSIGGKINKVENENDNIKKKKSFYNILGSIFNLDEETDTEINTDIKLESENKDETNSQIMLSTSSEVAIEEAEEAEAHLKLKNPKLQKNIFSKKKFPDKNIDFNKINDIEIDFSLEDTSKIYNNIINTVNLKKKKYNCNQLEYNYGDKEANIVDNEDLIVDTVQPSNYVNFRQKFSESNVKYKKKIIKDDLAYWTKRSDIARPWFKHKD